jgi:CBS domain-containing protein
MSEQAVRRDLIALPVSQVMSHPVFSVTADVVLGDALAAMVRTGRRHIAVVDDAFRCLGVVGDRAVASAWASDPTALARSVVGQLLEPRPAVVGSDATVRDVARTMCLDSVDAVAVIDRGGCPIGIVTGGDLVALMAAQDDADPLEAEVLDPDRLEFDRITGDGFEIDEDDFGVLISETPD